MKREENTKKTNVLIQEDTKTIDVVGENDDVGRVVVNDIDLSESSIMGDDDEKEEILPEHTTPGYVD